MRQPQPQVAQLGQAGQLVVGQPAHVLARRLVAQDQRVGLAAMDQRHRHAGIGGVEEAPLPLDDVPVVGVVVGRQPLDRAGHEIGDHRVERHAVAGDQDAGLAGGAEARLHAALVHLALHREGGVHLADRAVGADRQAALAGPALAVGDGVLDHRHAHVEQLLAVLFRRRDQLGLVAQQVVQARGHVHAARERLLQHLDPGLRDHAAAVGHADHQRLGAGLGGLGHGHVRQAHIGLAARQPELADRGLGAPVLDALRHLGGQGVGRIAQEQQIRLAKHCFLVSSCEASGAGYRISDRGTGANAPAAELDAWNTAFWRGLSARRPALRVSRSGRSAHRHRAHSPAAGAFPDPGRA